MWLGIVYGLMECYTRKAEASHNLLYDLRQYSKTLRDIGGTSEGCPTHGRTSCGIRAMRNRLSDIVDFH
jgi:hypothetical protein